MSRSNIQKNHVIQLFSLVIAGVVMLAGSPSVTDAMAQTGILPSSEVKRLVASAKTADDHTRLSKHYEAVAAKHEADAKEHEALAEEYTKNPSFHDIKHPMSPETAAHCKLYAEHCRKAAAEARAIAATHVEMAAQAGK